MYTTYGSNISFITKIQINMFLSNIIIYAIYGSNIKIIKGYNLLPKHWFTTQMRKSESLGEEYSMDIPLFTKTRFIYKS